DVIAQIKAQGGEAIVCHPYWCGHTIADLAPLDGYMAVEVYNDTCEQIGKGYSEAHWDELLDKVGPCWGIAADDAHDRTADCYHAWVLVKSERPALPGILGALRRGAYYCTQGPEIRDLRLEAIPGETDSEGHPRRRVVVETSPAVAITFKAQR